MSTAGSLPTASASEDGAHVSSLPVQLSEPPKGQEPRQGRDKHDDYYANVGDAIRTLRDEIPFLFAQDLTYDIYTDDICFRDPMNTFCGKKDYSTIFWSLRFHGKLFFSSLFVEVKRIWQDPTNDSIKMRWTVHGVPRVPWEAEGTFDGISTYKVDRHGKIYDHKVDNVVLRDPPFALSPLFAGLKLRPVQQQAMPGACTGFWARFYMALQCTVKVLELSEHLADGARQARPDKRGDAPSRLAWHA